jgi:hypothetical protein
MGNFATRSSAGQEGERRAVQIGTEKRIVVMARPSRGDFTPELLEKVSSVANEAFGKEMPAQNSLDVIFDARIVHLFEKEGKLVGWSAYTMFHFPEGNVLFIDGTVVSKDCQREGFRKSSIDIAVGELRPVYLATRTQSPVIYYATSKLVSDIHPSLAEPDKPMVELGEALANLQRMDNYDPGLFLERGTYGRSLYTEIPTIDDPEVKRLFEEKLALDQRNGDCVLILGRVINPIPLRT